MASGLSSKDSRVLFDRVAYLALTVKLTVVAK